MKKFLIIPTLLLVILLVGCSKNTTPSEKTGDSSSVSETESETTLSESASNVLSDSDDSSSETMVDAISDALLAIEDSDEKDVTDYSTLLKSLSTYSDALEGASPDSETIELQTDTVPLDLSASFQWMSDHYDQLTKEDQTLFDSYAPVPKELTVSSEESKITGNQGFLSSLAPLSLTAYADDVPDDFMVVYSTNPRLYIHCADYTVGTVVGPTVREALDNSVHQYKDIVGAERKYVTVINLRHLGPTIESLSFMKYVTMDDGSVYNVFYININQMLSNELTKASVYYELFRVYLASIGYFPERTKDQFFIEATSIWAVSRIEEDYGYHKRYSKYLYEEPTLDYTTMDLNLMKSWYQLFYFIDQEKGDLDLVKSIIQTYKDSPNISEALLASTEKALRVHNFFAYFSAYLFESGPFNTLELENPSPFFDHTFEDGVYTTMSHEDLTSLHGETYDDFAMDSPGFKAIMVSAPETRNALFDAMVNAESMETRDKIGMLLYVETSPGIWKSILNGRYDNFLSDHVDFKNSTSQRVVAIFFDYDFNNTVAQKYRWDYKEKLVGEGSIEVSVTRSPINDTGLITPGYELLEHLTILEDLELYNEAGSDQTGAYTDLILGDVFYVKSMNVLYNSHYTKDDQGNKTERTTSGNFTYNDGDLGPHAFSNNLITTPELSSPPPLVDSTAGDGDLQDIVNDAMEGLEGLGDLGIPGLEDLLPTDELQSSLDELNNIDLDFDGILGSLMGGMDKLVRTKETPESQMFLFYQTLPNTLYEEEWLGVTEVTTSLDAEGKSITNTRNWDETLPGDVIPLWFYNYNFDIEAGESYADTMSTDPADYENVDTEWTMDQLSYMNGIFNKENLYQCLNDGPRSIPIEDINSHYSLGVMNQGLTFENNIFEGSIVASYDDDNGEKVDVTIKFRYDFNN